MAERVEIIARAMVRGSRPSSDPDKLTPAPRGSVGLVPLWKLYEHMAQEVNASLPATPDRSDDALAEERGWQPIETAPRDGTEFLALVSNGWYALVSAPAEALREGWPYQWWRSNDRQSYPVIDTHSADSEWGNRLLLTHWMPLPTAPAAHLLAHSHPEKQA